MNGWQATTLGEVCSLITDGKHGDCTNEKNSGYYFISAKDIREGIVNYENARQITESDFAETHRRTDLQPGDLLVTNSGTIGRLAIAHDNERTLKTTFQKSVAILKPKPCEISSRFLYYYLTANMKAFIHPAAGAAQKNLLLRDIRAFRIYKPSLHEQDNISRTLSNYDDLIENNRRRIALLEEAARLLYREWFVHFRFTGHEHVKIIDGLPEGWERVRVADKFDTTSGGTPSRSNPDFFSGNINWVKTQELNERPIFETSEKITEEAIARSSAKLLPVQTLLVSIYGNTNIGRTGLLALPGSSNQACVALLPKRRKEDWIYAQLWIQQHREQIVGLAQGAAQTNISQKTLRGLVMIWPTSLLLATFLDSVLSSYQQIECLCLQNTKLV